MKQTKPKFSSTRQLLPLITYTKYTQPQKVKHTMKFPFRAELQWNKWFFVCGMMFLEQELAFLWGFRYEEKMKVRGHGKVLLIFFLFTLLPLLTDIDECSDNSHNCHLSATCTNTVGSFTCSCNAGYTGDGITCSGKYRFGISYDSLKLRPYECFIETMTAGFRKQWLFFPKE